MYFFGSGSLYGRQTGVSNPTPIRFGGVQGVNVDMSFTNKSLRGQYQMPLDSARGEGTITGKASFAQINGLTLNNLFFGESSLGTTPTFTAVDEVQAVTANTVNVTNNATFVEDLGVTNVTTGLAMLRVASAPAGTGNYSCNESTGTYTFNTAMNNASVMITYDYTGNAGSGSSIVIANQLSGSAPQFMMVLAGTLKGNKMRLKLNACQSTKLSFATKLSDYALPDFEFEAFADVTGNVGTLSFTE